jgi:hypothetical protein
MFVESDLFYANFTLYLLYIMLYMHFVMFVLYYTPPPTHRGLIDVITKAGLTELMVAL